jgi:hypothetical protein
MTIETLIEANTAAVVALTEVTQRLYELRGQTITEIKGIAADAKAPSKAAAAKAVEAAAAKVAEPAEPAAAAVAEPTHRLAAVADAAGKYLGGTDRAEERDARTEKVSWLFGRVEATKLGEIPEGQEGAVLEALTTLIAQGDLTTPPAAAGLLG